MKYVKAKKLNHVVGKDAIFTDTEGILVTSYIAGETIFQMLVSRLKILISSGIYQLWIKWYSTKQSHIGQINIFISY